ncbi:hypothetical protein IFU01_07740 [Oxalobacteraceae sp. CFBP 8763]|nr:hypothetical protein [Oxalobacteraceae sp. CFBP 8763]
MSIKGWSVDGLDMNNKTRQGGAHSLKGFSFQAAVALLRMVWLLTARNGVVKIRYDGAQDIDVEYANDKEVYIQAKDYGRGNFKLNHLHGVIAGFCRDIISSVKKVPKRKFQPTFQLILTDIPTQDEVIRVMRRSYLKADSLKVTALISEDYRQGMSDREIRIIAAKVLEEVDYVVWAGGSPANDLIEIASMELIRFGVEAKDVGLCIDRLLQCLEAGRTYVLEDAASKLVGLPSTHPASKGAAIGLLPGSSPVTNPNDIRKMFYRGSPVTWSAITSNLDIPRKDQHALECEIHSVFQTGGMVVATGVAGSGKSTLIRRTAWDMHRAGRVIAFEVKNPDEVKDEHWIQIESLLQLSDRPILVIIDDIWRFREFLERFDRVRTSRLCLLATSRPGERIISASFNFPIAGVSLGKVDDDEFNELCKRLSSRPTPENSKVIEHARNNGQMLVLALVMQGHSIEEFVQGVLAALEPKIREIYLDVCIGSIYDMAMPLSIVNKISNGNLQIWESDSLKGLIFKSPLPTARLSAGHAIIASAAIQAAHLKIATRAIQISELCRHEDEIERRYALTLLECLVNDPEWNDACRAEAQGFEAQADRIAEYSSYIDLNRLSSILEKISAKKSSLRISDMASSETIISGQDAASFMANNSSRFSTVFDILYRFYEKNSTSFGRRRFINLTRNAGHEQKKLVADMTVRWVREHGFPAAETFALFNLLTFSGRELGKDHTNIVKEYIDRHPLTEDIALAALRLVTMCKDSSIYKLLYPKLIEALVSGELKGNEAVAIQTARPCKRLGEDSGPILEILNRMLAQRLPTRPSISLLETIVHNAPISDFPYLQSIIDKAPLRMRGRRLRNVEQIILRRTRENGVVAQMNL